MEAIILDQLQNNNIIIINEFCHLLYNFMKKDILDIYPTNIFQEVLQICNQETKNNLQLF
jgi:hypothetical protein